MKGDSNKLVLSCIVFVCLSHIISATEDESNEQMRSFFDLLKGGEENIELSDEHKDVVLVLGNTGSGKSTLTQWIAGDNDKLISIEVGKNTGEFLINDFNRIGNSTIESKTVFPELVLDAYTRTAYYDCPGFSDTRSTSNDIATTYFIKKVIDHARSVKMVFVISYPSVRKGVDRQDFMKLARHATDLIKDVDKFRNSISIVATKVDNQYVKRGNDFVLVEDEKVIQSIADFFDEVKLDLTERIQHPGDVSLKEQSLFKNITKFIDVLLKRGGDDSTKIGIFRRPDQPGPLSNITLLQKGKISVERIIRELNFTEKNDDDFGYTISDKSKNDISDLVEEINKNLWSALGDITNKIQKYYDDLAKQVQNKINSFVTSTTVAGEEQSTAQNFSNKLDHGYNVTVRLFEELENVTNPKELAEKVNKSIDISDFFVSQTNLLNIANQGKYFDFLQLVSDKELKTRQWAKILEHTLPHLSKTTETIQNNVNEVAEKIKDRLSDILQKIQRHYREKMKSLEIEVLHTELEKDLDIMYSISSSIENTTMNNLLKAINTIQDKVHGLGIDISMQDVMTIANQNKYLHFLQTMTKKDLSTGALLWISPFEKAVSFLDDSVEWYSFLNDLYEKFSQYEIQKEKAKYNVADIKDWGSYGKPQGIEITPDNFELFFSKIMEYNFTAYNTIKNRTMTTEQLTELNQVLNVTLNHKISILCKEPYLSIKGNFVRLTGDIQETVQNGFISDSCGNFTQLFEKVKSSKIKFVNIFALQAVFIDEDIGMNGLPFPITVIAPKWITVGTRTIDLHGSEGLSYDYQTDPSNPWLRIRISALRAKDGTQTRPSGENGKPGRAGNSGGTFFGISEQFVNCGNLTVTLDGGTGGTGQNGGNGWNGTDGKNAVTPSASDTSCRSYLCDGSNKIYGYTCTKVNCKTMQMENADIVDECSFKIFGEHGKKGGSGGDGGKGGKGGKPGTVRLFELESDSGISIHRNFGRDGEGGIGGIGGISGANGNDVVARCTPPVWWLFRFKTKWYQEQTIYNNRDPAGKKGTNSANALGIEDPKEADTTIDKEMATIINEYKSYLKENLVDRLKRYSLMQFLMKLDENSNVRKSYDTLRLFNEMQNTEEQFHNLRENVDLVPIYQSLLSRISEYAKNPKQGENSMEHKKVLNYLYTATLSRIHNIKSGSESNFTIDVREYLDLVTNDIRTLKDLQNANNKAKIIQKYTENYKSKTDDKIKEAKNLIEKEITPEIDNIGDKIDSKIDLLITETIELKEQTRIEEIKLTQKRQELQNTIGLRGLFDCFKIIGAVTSFLGPIGLAVGTVVGTVSTVTESLVLDPKNSQIDLTKLPSSVIANLKSLGDQIKNAKNNKIDHFNKLLEEIAEKARNNQVLLGDTAAKVDEIKKKLKQITGNNLNEIKSLETNLKEELKRKENELKSQISADEEKTLKSIKLIGKFQQAIQICSVGFDVYAKYKEDQSKLDEVTEAIEKARDKFQMLEQYEESIYNVMIPMLKEMGNNLTDIASSLGNKSHVSLDVTKWKVQSILQEMQSQMQRLTQGFQAQDELVHCVGKLEDAMTILINIYDRIQNYQEEQELVNHITDISSATAISIDITDTTLINTVNYLEYLIRSNLVLKQYEIAINSFKQWVFPFAHLYLEKSMLPRHLQLENNLSNLVSAAVKQIESLKAKLDLYRTSIERQDEFIYTTQFDSQHVSTRPFYAWKNEEYRDMISDLLSGKEVIVKADITNSPSDKDAIKFNVVDLYFKSRNDTLQSEIDNAVKGFKMSATHLGNSYYRYGSKVYLIMSDSLTITCSFEKNALGEPLDKNMVYNKLKSGSFMLSPYSVWKIKLTTVGDDFSFADLEIYKDKIDVELTGNGSYVTKEAHIVSPMTDDDYTALNAHSVQDLRAETNYTLLPLQDRISKSKKIMESWKRLSKMIVRIKNLKI